MEQIKLFDNPQFGAVRTLEEKKQNMVLWKRHSRGTWVFKHKRRTHKTLQRRWGRVSRPNR